ncbi:hypothetical protein BZG36_00684 [Bifiguratus adelaidae]|uniref:NADH:ubiquinone reductase (non-electrogenic) n=1 Tax=Bifiguratus adelaidae TaxID=1938954 RepID=A0A261Y6M1_9FUNG|nr:hypothetical protein BZG36_00684 [Bifiguratus adelaidae]
MASVQRTMLGVASRSTQRLAMGTAFRNGVMPIQRRFASTTAPAPRRSRLRLFGRVIGVGLLGGAGYTAYGLYVSRHPPMQKPFDPTKKTIAVLGSGWASTSFLKSIDTSEYNVVVISPRNYFLFTPLLPSCTVGTVDVRSIVEPVRFISRHKEREVKVYEAECKSIDPVNKTLTFVDTSEIKSDEAEKTIPYDYLVLGCGSQNQTFGIKGVEEHACFLKEVWDAQKIRTRLMDCVETAAFVGQSDAKNEQEIDRLLHMVVVGGGPTGVEYAAELYDFLKDDLTEWYPDIAGKIKITLVEALPNVLPAFSKQLIDYTESTFKEQNIEILTKTMVKEVKDKEIIVQQPDGSMKSIPYGLLVWATGNTSRPLIRDLMAKMPESQTMKRGLLVDDHLRLLGAEDVYALGDATATKYAPTAQVAAQQGKYLARVFNQQANRWKLEREYDALTAGSEKDRLARKINKLRDVRPFHYSHQGSLAYIGSEKAIADLPFLHGNISAGGVATYVFWRSAYLSNLFSIRNRALVAMDWIKKNVFGRDISRE